MADSDENNNRIIHLNWNQALQLARTIQEAVKWAQSPNDSNEWEWGYDIES